MKTTKKIFLIAILLILTMTVSVKAGSITISSNKTSLEVGQTATITITGVNATGQVNVTSSNSNVLTVSQSSGWIENSSITVTVTAKAAGTANIVVKPDPNGDVVDSTTAESITGSRSVSITVKAPVVEPEPEPEPEPNPETPAEPSTPPATPTKSSNANLSNLGITPNDFTGFRAGTTSYSVSVPNDVTTIEVYAKKGHSAQTITGTGTKSLSEGSNVFPVVVTAEDGTKKTYQITVIRLAKEESNNPDAKNNPVEEVALASLEIENVTLNEAFSPDILEYTAKADAEAEKVVVRATANVESAKVEVTGAEEYTPGENIIRVTVTSENGEDSKTYVIRVQKEETQEVLGTTDNDNTIPVVAGVTDNGSNDGNGGIGTTKLLFCIGIGVVALLGIVFAVIRYNKDKKEVTNELEPIDFASTFNPKEAVKDVVSATSKLSSMDSEPITENDGATKKNKGRHF